jgi:hypothetical protein
LLIGGCVAKSELREKEDFFSATCGFSMNIWAISFLFTASIVGSTDIFLSAEAKSQRSVSKSQRNQHLQGYSRFLDKANLKSEEIR